jgi:type I site-specific restriction endonuclease
LLLVDMLMRANWARRVLFLADRIALVNQARRELNKHLPHVSVASRRDKKQEEARVVFSTYPTMLNCIDGTRQDITDTFSVAHFDLVIIDEAKLSVYQKYGAIFDYFDSLQLLTGPPHPGAMWIAIPISCSSWTIISPLMPMSWSRRWRMERGTRLCENLFAPDVHKKESIIFDYCQNLEFFDANPDG